jgi:hypothetical protein
MNVVLQRRATQQARQKLEATRQLADLLAQTPLSLAQQNLLAELQIANEGYQPNRGAGILATLYPIEPPCFRQSEFSPAKVTESACGAVRIAAEAAGAAVRMSITCPATARAKGNAEHIHQLFTLLAVSPLTLAEGINAIDLRAAWNSKGGTAAELELRIALSTKGSTPDLLTHLLRLTSAVPASQAQPLNAAEFGLAAGWQLAIALGACIGVELQNGTEACLLATVPLELIPETTPPRPDLPSVKGNGEEPNHNRNGRNGGNGRHGKESPLISTPA